MEEKAIQPTIQMKNSSIVIVKNSASIIFGLFFILLFFARPFRKSKCSECKNERRKRLKKKSKRPSILEGLLLFSSSVHISHFKILLHKNDPLR